MKEEYYTGTVNGRDIEIDVRYNIAYVYEIVEKVIHRYLNEDGFMSCNATHLAEEIDSELYGKYKAVNCHVDANQGIKYHIGIHWDTEKLYESGDTVNQMVHNVLRGLPV